MQASTQTAMQVSGWPRDALWVHASSKTTSNSTSKLQASSRLHSNSTSKLQHHWLEASQCPAWQATSTCLNRGSPQGLQCRAMLQRSPDLTLALRLHHGTGCWAAGSLMWPCLNFNAAARRAVSQQALPLAAAPQTRDLTWPCPGWQAVQHAADQRAFALQALPPAAAPQTGSWRCR